jgi:hypothetical protein
MPKDRYCSSNVSPGQIQYSGVGERVKDGRGILSMPGRTGKDDGEALSLLQNPPDAGGKKYGFGERPEDEKLSSCWSRICLASKGCF